MSYHLYVKYDILQFFNLICCISPNQYFYAPLLQHICVHRSLILRLYISTGRRIHASVILGHLRFRKCYVACSVPCHCLDQCWDIIIWTLDVVTNFSKVRVRIQPFSFKQMYLKVSSVIRTIDLSRPPCVNMLTLVFSFSGHNADSDMRNR